jgi:hypothetical protein
VACDEGKEPPDNLNAATSNAATTVRLVKGDEQAARIGLEKHTDPSTLKEYTGLVI